MTEQIQKQEQRREQNGRRYNHLIEDAKKVRETAREDLHMNFRESLISGLQELAKRAYEETTDLDFDSHIRDLCTLRYAYILVNPSFNKSYESLALIFDQTSALIKDTKEVVYLVE